MNTVSISGGTIATDYGVFRADLLVRDGRITAILEDGADLPSTDERIDARGLVVLPGGLDPHCHLREPASSGIQREGWRTGTMAAAAGGVTTVLEYPQAEPPVKDLETLALKRGLAQAQSVIDFALWGGAIKDAVPHMAAMHEAGVVGYKAFMRSEMPHFPGIDDGTIMDVLENVKNLGSVFSLHCENAAIQLQNISRMVAEGKTYPMAHCESRPPIVEYEAVARFFLLAKYVGARVHVPHVTCVEVAELIKQAKRDGLSVSAETCPQYLLLDETELERLGTWARCGPPLRSRANVERLWDYVLDGTIDYHASDHAPYTPEEKERGHENIFLSPSGLIGNQYGIPLVLDEAYHRRGMSLDHFARYSATNAARRLGLYPRKGTIRVGADADLVLYDLEREWVIDRQKQFNRHKYTNWHGRQVGVKVMRTVVRGETVYDGEEIRVAPGYGRFIPRTYGAEASQPRPAIG